MSDVVEEGTSENQQCPVCEDSFIPQGLGGHITQSHDDEEVCQAAIQYLQDVADELGRTPTREEIDRRNGPSAGLYNSRFGGMNAAFKAAGLQPNVDPNPPESDQDFLEDIERVAAIIDGRPQLSDYRKHGEYQSNHCYSRFDGWLDALSEADLPPPKRAIEKSDEKLLNELQQLQDSLGRQPTTDEAPHDKIVYRRRWGSYTEACRAAGIEAQEYRGSEFTPRGADHPNWKDDARYQNGYAEGWTETKRQQIRDRDEHTCQECGETQKKHLEQRGTKLHVHHIDGDKSNHSITNLITLCAGCHGAIEAGVIDCPKPPG